MKAALDTAGVIEQDAALRQAAGQGFYNTSPFSLRDLRARANRRQLTADFEAWLGEPQGWPHRSRRTVAAARVVGYTAGT